MDELVCLYVIVRNDMASMPPGGKAAAQATHAGNQMVYQIDRDNAEQVALLKEWEDQTGFGFGTTITIGASDAQMRKAVENARWMNLHTGIVNDPTYPLLDGKVLHLIPLDTCAYIFGRRAKIQLATNGLGLLPLGEYVA